ncbi:MAG: carboxypeptidase-like regulatory domain-containing protein, partial [Bryobacteraceae bacterium]
MHPMRLSLLLLALSLAPLASAQTANASLTGVVRDPTNVPVPSARVRLVNEATNLERRSLTTDTGNYTIPALPPGSYRLEVEANGFKKAIVSGILLEVAQQARTDVSVEIGQVTESVTVTTQTPLLETESNVIGNVVTSKSITSIPLNGRNFMELVTLAGATNAGNNATAKNTSLAGTSRGLAPSVAGAPATENNYQLDGTDNREPFFNSYGLAPSVDAVREFKIQVGQYSAEYGAGGGAVINVVTRSGTNEFHGTAFEFVRNDVFDARNTFLTPTQKINALRRNQFGVSAGGPVYIPKIYNGKDRTFIFGNFDLVRQRTASLRTSVVPTEAQRTGNLAGLNRVNDPFAADAPFPNNVIPTSRIDPISARLVQQYPRANNPAGAQNYFNNIPALGDQDTWLLRGDHRIANGHEFTARYADQKLYTFNPGPVPNFGGFASTPTI